MFGRRSKRYGCRRVKTLSRENKGLLYLFFKDNWDYIAKLGPIFALTSLIFIYSIFIGYSIAPDVSPQSFEGVLSNIPDPVDSTSFEMFLAILYNNVFASFLFMLSGVFLGLPPLMFMAFNGFFVGYVSYNAAQIQGIGFVLATILPHGIIEIPAIVLCGTMGVGLGYQLIFKLMRREGLQKYATESLMIFLKRIIPLLVLAAGIETALIYSLI
ncbi:MAG TPA: stage II sporulation protein M [Candidatus Bathyarchaeota archaeon]|nr:stage II sporulation protein M [Candidatus Bathyarchaeota archaeon]